MIKHKIKYVYLVMTENCKKAERIILTRLFYRLPQCIEDSSDRVVVIVVVVPVVVVILRSGDAGQDVGEIYPN